MAPTTPTRRPPDEARGSARSRRYGTGLRRPRRERQETTAQLSAATSRIAENLRVHADGQPGVALTLLAASPKGLTNADARQRLERFGPNRVVHDQPPHPLVQLAATFKNPFIVVLGVLAIVQALPIEGLQDPVGVATLTVMIAISVALRFFQEFRSTRAAERLSAMVSTTATVLRRDGEHADPTERELPFDELVPGDVVRLAAGDMIPADSRLLSTKDLFVSQAVLSGEALPVEKYDTFGDVREKGVAGGAGADDVLELGNVCFMGTSVISGAATAVVLGTGSRTYFGSMARALVGKRPETSFDKGVRSVSYLLIRFMLVMVPIVFLINGVTKGWADALLFSLAVAVGLTPEMMPVVVTANLARGAVKMARRKVIVKRLNAIQNLGAMDVLCTDKTGTLTEDRIVLERYLGPAGRTDAEVLRYAYLNSAFQTGLKNRLDEAVVEQLTPVEREHARRGVTKVDEIPFDFVRRRMSVVVSEFEGEHVLVTKGAVEEVLEAATRVREDGHDVALDAAGRARVLAVSAELNRDGMRVLGVALRRQDHRDAPYGVADERDLTFLGMVAFLDPPKASAGAAIEALHGHGVVVKVLTGDNELVAGKVCREIGLEPGEIVLGHQIEDLDEARLGELAERTTVFAKVNPLQKARIVQALQAGDHTVGFMGDGINDAPALRDADVGISVDTAVDIAKESADVILLEKDLMVLEQGVLDGRMTFGNIIKYIKMTASSNFGNVFSVLVASAVLPFTPMLSIQLLIQNLLYDLSQLAIPWDRMDPEYLKRPRKWQAPELRRFMLWIGPTSSIFDLSTYAGMWFLFGATSHVAGGPTLFHSGWFVEGLLSQTLIVHLLRTERLPFIQSRATWPVLTMTSLIIATGIYLPFSPLADTFQLTGLPGWYFPFLFGTLLSYCLVVQAMKRVYIRRFGSWL